MASNVGDDPFRVLLFGLLVLLGTSGFVAEGIDVFLRGRLRELSALDAEIPAEQDLLDEHAAFRRNDHVRAKARDAIERRLRFTDETFEERPEFGRCGRLSQPRPSCRAVRDDLQFGRCPRREFVRDRSSSMGRIFPAREFRPGGAGCGA